MRLVMIAAAIAGPVFAADTVPTVLTVTGEPGWEMTCHVWPKGRDEYVRFLDKGSSGLSAADLSRLECAYKASSRGPIVITIVSPTLACPFKDASASACTTTLPKGRPGSFEVHEKSKS